MKSRVPYELTPEAAKQLEKFRMFLEAKDDVAQQVVAAMLYAYHLQGYRRKRINQMFENLLSIINLPAEANIEGVNLMDFLKDKYGINFDLVKLQTETEQEYLKRVMK